MARDWILDVLEDLRTFAGKNGLDATERQLDQAMVVVADELGSGQGIARGTAHVGHVGEFHRPVAGGRDS